MQPIGDEVPKQPVALLLLDINIPDVNGLDVLKRVKEMFDQLNQKKIQQLADQNISRDK